MCGIKYTDEMRVQKIYEYVEKLYKYIKDNNVTKDMLLNDYAVQWLVTTPLYNVGENVYYLSKEYKEQHNHIPWNMISGLRHRLVHDYDGTNWNIIADVVFEELPDFLKQLKMLV